MADLHSILGISKEAGETEIKKAFRKIALECHPDRYDNGRNDYNQYVSQSVVPTRSHRYVYCAGSPHLLQNTKTGLRSVSRQQLRPMKHLSKATCLFPHFSELLGPQKNKDQVINRSHVAFCIKDCLHC